jgi:hypothetical protein
MSSKFATKYITDFLESHGDEDLQTKWKDAQKDFNKGFKKSENRSSSKKASKKGPSKNKTAYNFFCSEERLKVKEQLPDLSNKEIFTEMGSRWATLKEKSPTALAKYQKMADEDKARYLTEKENYVPQEKEDEEVEEEPKKKRKAKVIKDGPKKAKTSYMFFCEAERKVVNKEKPDLNGKEVLVELGSRWAALKEKDPKKIKTYENLAEKDKLRYQSEKNSSTPKEDAGSKKASKEPEPEPEEEELLEEEEAPKPAPKKKATASKKAVSKK